MSGYDGTKQGSGRVCTKFYVMLLSTDFVAPLRFLTLLFRFTGCYSRERKDWSRKHNIVCTDVYVLMFMS